MNDGRLVLHSWRQAMVTVADDIDVRPHEVYVAGMPPNIGTSESGYDPEPGPAP